MTNTMSFACLAVAALALSAPSAARAAEAAAVAAPAAAAGAAAAPPSAAAPASPKPDEVKASSGPAAPSIASIYTAERLRDPFAKAAGGAVASAKPMAPEDFNIHNLSLRGLMKDAAADYALFTDANFGASFILRKGQLLDIKGKAVPGVTGSLNLKQKTANLVTRDNDVQVFRLGEEEEAKKD